MVRTPMTHGPMATLTENDRSDLTEPKKSKICKCFNNSKHIGSAVNILIDLLRKLDKGPVINFLVGFQIFFQRQLRK